MADERRYPRPADLAAGLGVPEGWQPDGIVLRRGVTHEVSVVQEVSNEQQRGT